MAAKQIRTQQLTTPFEESVAYDWREYPRPQLKRDSYLSLCGAWQLSVVRGGDEQPLGDVTVPYPPESRISGICRELREDEYYIYRKRFSLDSSFIKGKTLINFGAVDQIAQVYINGILAGSHVGGYLPFTVDISDYVDIGENTVTVEVTDKLDTELPYGKQRRDRGGMWYTPISGIWQPVWIECVPDSYFSSVRITPTLDSVTIEVNGGRDEKTLTLHGDADKEYKFIGSKVTIDIPSAKLWTPEQPFLYYFTLTDGEDTINSYFALRTVTIEKRGEHPYICLNGEPYFFNGVLDQGYYSDGIYIPSSPEGYIYDIQTMKKLGFNMLRKHIKIEPELFYYYCDKYGMIVFQDLVNSGRYDFLIDTALPTIGLRRGITHKASPKRRAQFEADAAATLELLYDHPSVVYYTIFNEGWGQYDADRIYRELKRLDTTRIFDATSGWFVEKESDVISEHIYFRKLKLKGGDRPLVLSEFGGYSYPCEGHCFNLDKSYGYKACKNAEEFTSELENLYLGQLLPCIEQGLNAAVLTQLSDVEDEINGLVTYDRRVIKVDEAVMNSIAKHLYDKFRENF